MWLQLTQTSRAQADLQSVVDSISALWLSTFLQQVPATVTVTQVEGVWLTPGSGEIIAFNSTTRTGLGGGTIIADASGCYVMSWHLNAYYRGGHPRTYFPGVITGAVTNGSAISSGQQSNMQTEGLAFLNGVNALTHGGITAVKLGTVSFASGNAWRSPPLFRPFTGSSCSPLLGTQRRRIKS